MKLNALLFLILILPVLISGTNFSSFAHPDFDSDTAIRKQYVPSINPARNRNWRVESIEYQTDEDFNGILEPNMLYDYCYNDTNPAKIDSIWVMQWVTDFENWGYEHTKNYIYDDAGEHVIQLQYYLYINNMPYFLIDCEYTTNQRLMDVFFRTYDWDNGVYHTVQSVHYTYTNNALASVMIEHTGSSRAYYERFIIDSDANGRPETIYGSASPDLINWGNTSLEEITYHAHDTTTGLDYIDFLSHEMIFYDEWDGLLGMIDTYSNFREWNGVGWDSFYFDTYTYNTSNQVTDILTQFMDVSFVNESLHHYVYNTNNNLSYYTNQLWDMDSQAWDIPDEKYIYNWGEYTHNEDDTILPAPMSLNAYPNPFNDIVDIRFNGKDNAPVETSVFNIKGQLIKSFGKSRSASITWDGKDNNGKSISNGIYFIKTTQEGKSISKKVIRIK